MIHHKLAPTKDAVVMTKHLSQWGISLSTHYTTANSFCDASGGSINCCADDPKLSESQTRSIPDGCKVIPVDDTLRNGISFTAEHDDEDKSAPTDSLPSPKYTMSEKWIMDQQRKKLIVDQSWVLKQQKTKRRIATCFDKLKVCYEISAWLHDCYCWFFLSSNLPLYVPPSLALGKLLLPYFCCQNLELGPYLYHRSWNSYVTLNLKTLLNAKECLMSINWVGGSLRKEQYKNLRLN